MEELTFECSLCGDEHSTRNRYLSHTDEYVCEDCAPSRLVEDLSDQPTTGNSDLPREKQRQYA